MNDSDDLAFGRTPNVSDRRLDESLDEMLDENIDESGVRRVSDDKDLEPQGSGVDETLWRREYSTVALRSDLARRFEDLVISVREWSRGEGSDASRALAADLEDLYGRIGEPVEDSDPVLDDPNVGDLDAPA